MPTALFPLTGQSIGTANLFRSVFHGSRSTNHGFSYFLTSLLPCLRNGNALSAAMGAAAKRAHRLQEGRSLHVKDSVFRRRRRRWRRRQELSPIASLHCVVHVHPD